MNRLKLLIIVFCVALAVPLAYFVVRTYQSLEQKERAELNYFAETLFNKMEEELAALVRREEGRRVDEYSRFIVSDPEAGYNDNSRRSPLSETPDQGYILGYFQNSTDGSMQTPLLEINTPANQEQREIIARLHELNSIFNLRRTKVLDSVEPRASEPPPRITKEKEAGFADRYFAPSQALQKDRLGQESKRVEEITVAQANNIAKQELRQQLEGRTVQRRPDYDLAYKSTPSEAVNSDRAVSSEMASGWNGGSADQKGDSLLVENELSAPTALPAGSAGPPETFQAEITPLQSVSLDKDHLYIFRRIIIGNQVYRQGFIIKVKEFLNHLVDTYFSGQPMTAFTSLQLKIMDAGEETAAIQSGANTSNPRFILDRSFPRPFSFLHATLACDQIPRSTGRSTLNIMIIILAAVILLGMFSIYQSTRVIVDLSERRAGFVSSVTHELKTPLTNIRMYIEMLHQGIARDKEREEEYFRILDSESNRLTRLINNVLEFSKLEKKQQQVVLTEGDLSEVISEVKDIMGEKLRQEGFTLAVVKDMNDPRPFKYAREGMIQVLTNLIDNSIKFGREAAIKKITIKIWSENGQGKLSVSDTGPGIERHALKKIFNDFYRVDNSLTRTTQGTGIGLALVKKIVTAMGGTVSAANNQGPGSTISITFPS